MCGDIIKVWTIFELGHFFDGALFLSGDTFWVWTLFRCDHFFGGYTFLAGHYIVGKYFSGRATFCWGILFGLGRFLVVHFFLWEHFFGEDNFWIRYFFCQINYLYQV